MDSSRGMERTMMSPARRAALTARLSRGCMGYVRGGPKRAAMIQAMSLAAIRIVLVEPSHPGNIGAVARAMKNMALNHLVLVRPKAFPHAEATARASGAGDILERARVVESVTDAVADVGFVAATTSRPRDQNFRALDLHEAATRIFEMSGRGPAAVLFGAERTGLTNEELALAHLLIRIPANPAYPSLNLAKAVP